jgi:hypothetical protein
MPRIHCLCGALSHGLVTLLDAPGGGESVDLEARWRVVSRSYVAHWSDRSERDGDLHALGLG